MIGCTLQLDALLAESASSKAGTRGLLDDESAKQALVIARSEHKQKQAQMLLDAVASVQEALQRGEEATRICRARMTMVEEDSCASSREAKEIRDKIDLLRSKASVLTTAADERRLLAKATAAIYEDEGVSGVDDLSSLLQSITAEYQQLELEASQKTVSLEEIELQTTACQQMIEDRQKLEALKASVSEKAVTLKQLEAEVGHRAAYMQIKARKISVIARRSTPSGLTPSFPLFTSYRAHANKRSGLRLVVSTCRLRKRNRLYTHCVLSSRPTRKAQQRRKTAGMTRHWTSFVASTHRRLLSKIRSLHKSWNK